MNRTLLVIALVVILFAGAYFLMVKGDETSTMEVEEDTTSVPTQQGKLNITAVCEGALAYMTFSSGEEADIFVAECVEGKHPEVIERFKEEMNLGDGALI